MPQGWLEKVQAFADYFAQTTGLREFFTGLRRFLQIKKDISRAAAAPLTGMRLLAKMSKPRM
jgi:hypothetical protein